MIMVAVRAGYPHGYQKAKAAGEGLAEIAYRQHHRKSPSNRITGSTRSTY
jgi:hypothetical protein